MPSWNAAQAAPGIPPPPTGIAGGLNASQFPSLNPTQNPSSAPANNAQGGGQSALSVPPPPGVQQSPQQAAPAEQAGNMQAQALQALPPTQGSPAPNGVELASPQQAAAIAPPPAWDQTHNSLGGLTHDAAINRAIQDAQTEQRATNETALQFAQRKLAAIEPYLKTVDPQFANIIRMETVQGGNGATGMTAMINTVFGTPQKEQIDATDMAPDQKALYGLPPSATGKWTALRSRTGQILPGAYQGWAGTTTTTNTAGEQGKESTNTALANGGKLTAPGGGPSTVVAPQATTWVLDPQDPHYEIGVRKDRAGNTIAATAPDGSPLRRLKTGTLEHTSGSTTTMDEAGNPSTTRKSGVVIPPSPGASTTAPTGTKPTTQTTPGAGSGSLPKAVAPFNPSNRIDNLVALMAKDETAARGLMDARDKKLVTARMAQLGVDPNNVTGSMRDRAAQASTVLEHLNQVQGIIDEADKARELGLVATRWNDFLTGKLGEDPTKDHIFSKLATNLTFLQSAVAMAHGGVRAGGSLPMVEHWQTALAAKDPGTLRQQLNVAKSWMQGYAQMVPQGNHQMNQPTGSTLLQDLIKDHLNK